MMTKERRRYQRYLCAIPVFIRNRDGEKELVTANVSSNGVFVKTDSPRLERELLKLCFKLPEGDAIDLMGVVARRYLENDPDNHEERGMGIDFFFLSNESKKRWENYILTLPDPDGVEELDEGGATPSRRRYPRYLNRFLVKIQDKERLREFYTRDISGGGIFLNVPVPEQISSKVSLVLVHPESGEEYALKGTVIRVERGKNVKTRGVAINFDPLPPKNEASLIVFIESGVNYLTMSKISAKEVIELLRLTAETIPGLERAYLSIGLALMDRNAPDIAIKIFKKALMLSPDSVSLHEALRDAFAALGISELADRQDRIVKKLKIDS